MSWVTDNAVFLKLTPEQLFALTAYGEARGEGAEGMMAVLNVLNNRIADSRFYDNAIYAATGSPYHAVALKQGQFSAFNFGDPNRPLLVSIAENWDKALASNPTLQQAYDLSLMLFTGTLTDNTGGAVYYHAKNVTPTWASAFIPLGTIGNHVFYATKASLEAFQRAVAKVIPGVREEDYWIWLIPIGIVAWILLSRGSRRPHGIH